MKPAPKKGTIPSEAMRRAIDKVADRRTIREVHADHALKVGWRCHRCNALMVHTDFRCIYCVPTEIWQPGDGTGALKR